MPLPCTEIESEPKFLAVEVAQEESESDLGASADVCVEISLRDGRVLRLAESTVWRLLYRHGMTFKKTAHASEQQRPDVLRRRHQWFDLQPELDPERLVFIDETGASTKMARLRGRALRGECCRAPVPHGHWKTTAFVGALRLEGMTAPIL